MDMLLVYFFLSFNGLVIGDRLVFWLGLFLKKSRFIVFDNLIFYIGCVVKCLERFGYCDI